MNWILLKNSLLLAGSATLLTVCLGLAAALCIACLPRPGRIPLLALSIVALALPPFLVTNCWLGLLGEAGAWRSWLPWNIVSLGGAIWILAMLLWPIPMLAALSAWHRLEPELLESDSAVRGRHLIRGLLLPLAYGALAQSAVLVFVLALNNFAVPALLQVKVYPAEMWIRFSTNFDTPGALRLSWPMMLGPLLLLWWFRRRGVPWPHVQATVSAKAFRRQLGRPWFAASSAVTLMLLCLAVALPLGQLLLRGRAWTELPMVWAAGQLAVWQSLWLAAVAATAVVLAGLLVTGRFGGRSATPGSNLATLLWIPFFAPGIWLGILLIAVFNREWLGLFYTSAGIVILAFLIRYGAPGAGTILHAADQVDQNLVDAARLEGASRWQLLWRVRWPQIAPQVAAAWYIIFVLCLWDVESILLIVPPGVETLALRVFNFLHYGHTPQVDALCLTLLVLAIAPLLLWALWSARHAVRRLAPVHALSRVLLLVVAGLLVSSCTRSGSRPNSSLHSELFGEVEVIGSRGAGVGQLNKPRSVAVGADDALYVVDMTGRVQKFSPQGVYVLSWQMPETDLGKPKGMCRDERGDIVVIEPHYARVNHFSADGKLATQWGRHGTNAGEISVPRDVAVTDRAEVFVCEYQQAERVQKFVWDEAARQAGAPRWVASFGKPGNGPGEFSRPEGLCVDARGQVYVADSCNHRIQVFSSDGKFLRAYGKPGRGPGELSYPYDICVDAEGRQYVCEFGNSRIQVFDSQGKSIEIIGTRGAGLGQFSNPWGVALDSAGNLYVADSQNHRVQKLIRSPKTLARSDAPKK